MPKSNEQMREVMIKNFQIANSRRAVLYRKLKVSAWELTIRFASLFKRTLDITGAVIALIIFSPILAVTIAAIYLENPGPIFFTQIRVGKDGRHFRLYKFRSMVLGADKMKSALTDKNESGDGVIFKMQRDPRVTRVGRFIRKFSIDEMPQLINVLKGEMSLVGPRPPVPKEVDAYTLDQRKRLHVVPGITCIWQVSGRSDIPFQDQVRLDLEYIKSTGVLTDIAILLKTIPAVLGGRGAY